MLGLHCCVGFSLATNRAYSPLVVHRLLFEVASLVAEHGLQSTGSIVVVDGLSCSVARGIFPDQTSNLCALPWHMDSYPLYQQGSSLYDFCCFKFVRLSVAQNVVWYIFVNLPHEHENNVCSVVAIIHRCELYPVDQCYFFNIYLFGCVRS